MKTIEEVIARFKNENISSAFDGRDVSRISVFLTNEQITEELGLQLTDPTAKRNIVEFTRENVMKRLESDLAFAFEKALNKRGLSAGAMFYVIKMWCWILDDDYELVEWDDSNYAQYGLPLLKAAAVHYNLPNPIGNDEGTEFEYSSEADTYH